MSKVLGVRPSRDKTVERFYRPCIGGYNEVDCFIGINRDILRRTRKMIRLLMG